MYLDGFVIAVPTINRQQFHDHASQADALFKEQGATRIVEAWGDDVPKGVVTDFQRAVQATDSETVVFSWIEWPDKARRDAVMACADQWMNDPRMDPEKNPPPFDGARLIYGGFAPLLDEGAAGPGRYIEGFIIAVPDAKKNAYRDMAATAWPMFKAFGALRLVEAWADDVPNGKVTDFRRAVQAEADEQVVFSFIEWPDKETRDAGQKRMMEQDFDGEMPFDGKRMIMGGFRPIIEL